MFISIENILIICIINTEEFYSTLLATKIILYETNLRFSKNITDHPILWTARREFTRVDFPTFGNPVTTTSIVPVSDLFRPTACFSKLKIRISHHKDDFFDDEERNPVG